MTISIDRLSLWEIAHRWHNADPSHSTTIADIPLEIKDTLRNLAAEVYYERLYSTLLVEHEAENHLPIFKRNWPYFWKKTWFYLPASHYSKEFKEVMNNRIDPVFLQTIMITHWELEYWCREFQIPFPAFWIRAIVLGGSKAPFPGSIDFIQEDVGEPMPEGDILPEEKIKSESHSQAANQRHDPVNQLKRKCVIFSLTERNSSNNQVAKRFYASLSSEDKKLISTENANRLFSKAISDFKNAVDHYWLKDIQRP